MHDIAGASPEYVVVCRHAMHAESVMNLVKYSGCASFFRVGGLRAGR